MCAATKSRRSWWGLALALFAGCCAHGDDWLGDSLTDVQAGLAADAGLDEGVFELALTALDPATAQDVIDAIRGGTLLVAHYPDEAWLEGSAYLLSEDWSRVRSPRSDRPTRDSR